MSVNSKPNKSNKDNSIEKLILLKETCGEHFHYSICRKVDHPTEDNKPLYRFDSINSKELSVQFGIVDDEEDIHNNIYGRCVVIEHVPSHFMLNLEDALGEYIVCRDNAAYLKIKHTEVYDEQRVVVNCLTEEDKEYLTVLNIFKNGDTVCSQLNLLNVVYEGLCITDGKQEFSPTWKLETRSSIYYNPKIGASLTFINSKFGFKVKFNNVSGTLFDSYIRESLIADLSMYYHRAVICDSTLYSDNGTNVNLVDTNRRIDNCNSGKMIISNSEVCVNVYTPALKVNSFLLFNNPVATNKFIISNSPKLELGLDLLNATGYGNEYRRICKNIYVVRTLPVGEYRIDLSTTNVFTDLLKDDVFVYNMNAVLSKRLNSTVNFEVTCLKVNFNNITNEDVKRWIVYVNDSMVPLEKLIIDEPNDLDKNIVKFSNNNIRNFLELLKNSN